MAAASTALVSFVHPRSGVVLRAEIGSTLTGVEAVRELVRAGFVEPENRDFYYALRLRRTGAELVTTASLVSSGVTEGDIIYVEEQYTD